MHLDYVDIGTSDFDIGSGTIEYNKTYLLVEPVEYYLNNIPNTSNVFKANYAISDAEGVIDVYYVEESNIQKYNLPYWVRGCNKVNTKHPTVVKLLEDIGISEDIFTCKKVKCITFNTLRQIYNITYINKLKIDTEGHDHIVLKEVANCLFQSSICIDNIMLEYLPVFGNTDSINEICSTLKTIYPNQNIIGEDIYLSK